VSKRFEAMWGGRWGVLLTVGCAADPLSVVLFSDVERIGSGYIVRGYLAGFYVSTGLSDFWWEKQKIP
jgi:hypothetical protein